VVLYIYCCVYIKPTTRSSKYIIYEVFFNSCFWKSLYILIYFFSMHRRSIMEADLSLKRADRRERGRVNYYFILFYLIYYLLWGRTEGKKRGLYRLLLLICFYYLVNNKNKLNKIYIISYMYLWFWIKKQTNKFCLFLFLIKLIYKEHVWTFSHCTF